MQGREGSRCSLAAGAEDLILSLAAIHWTPAPWQAAGAGGVNSSPCPRGAPLKQLRDTVPQKDCRAQGAGEPRGGRGRGCFLGGRLGGGGSCCTAVSPDAAPVGSGLMQLQVTRASLGPGPRRHLEKPGRMNEGMKGLEQTVKLLSARLGGSDFLVEAMGVGWRSDRQRENRDPSVEALAGLQGGEFWV